MKDIWDSRKDSIKKALFLPVGELYADFGGTALPKKQSIDVSLVCDCAKELKNHNERVICSTQAEIIASTHSHSLGCLPSHLNFFTVEKK